MKQESRAVTWISYTAMSLFTAVCVIPFVLLILSSVTPQNDIIKYGYSFFPHSIDFQAYRYLASIGSEIARSFGISVFATLVGTVVGLTITALLAYPLSRPETPHRNIIMFLVFFTLLFNGGLVPSYVVNTELLHLKNTIWSLIIPGLLMNGFYVLLMRTFFQTTIPGALIEAARIDGAGEYRILWSIVRPLSTPVMATVGMFQSILYWNDWQNGMIYLTNPRLYSIQVLLNRIMQDIQYINENFSLTSNSAGFLQQMPTDEVRMAIAVIGVLPILLAYPFFQQYFVKGIMVGGIKG